MFRTFEARLPLRCGSARGIHKSWRLQGGQKGVSAKRALPRRRVSTEGGYRSWRLQSGKRSVSTKCALPRRRGSARGVIKVGVYRAGKGAFLQSAPRLAGAEGRRPFFQKKGWSHAACRSLFFLGGGRSGEMFHVERPGKGVGQKSFCNLRKTLAKKKGR